MKKYDGIIAALGLFWLVISVALFCFAVREEGTGENMNYKVEINRIMEKLQRGEGYSDVCPDGSSVFPEPDLSGMQYVKAVSFLPTEPEETKKTEKTIETREAAETEDTKKAIENETTKEPAQNISDFWQNRNGVHSAVYPLVIGEDLAGYVRFDYTMGEEDRRGLWLTEGVLCIMWLMTFSLLWYVRQKILKPFHEISQMPYELAKGNLTVEPEESKSRFFGRFVWGLGMLRDTLNDAKNKTLRLEKEKKLLLLSLSHDIKIPLSAIKLYAKALRENVCETQEQRINAASQIESHAGEIDEFVKKIVSTASEDIIDIQVADAEFYLRDYVNKIQTYYKPKCDLVMTRFTIGTYENKLLKGDMDRAFEVIENLMENAFKYGDGREISLEFYMEDYCQVMEVFNTGTTVPEKELPHLFDSFYRGNNAQDKIGNGLGLYIARQIMLKMQGDIFVKRKSDGMAFCLVFRT